MVDEDRPSAAGRPDPYESSRYYGPFGPPADPDATRPIGVGQWQVDQPDFHSPPPRTGSGYPSAPGSLPSGSFPNGPFPAGPFAAAPGPTAPVPSAGLAPAASTRTPRRRSGPGLILMAALVALLVGTLAGFGGARLAQRPVAEPAPGASTAPQPSAGSAPTVSPRQTKVPSAPGQIDTVSVAATVLPSTVMIRVGRSGDGSIGSGFVLDTSGHVMTNNHVVAGAADGDPVSVVFADGSTTSATLVGRSPSYDLAVIQVKRTSGLKPIQIGDSDATQVGQSVIAVGAPLGLPGTVTEGIVSAKNRPVVVKAGEDADAPSAYINGLQTDAPINPGNSGGPLIDAGARVIGVNSAILTLGQTRTQAGSIGLGFAIPVNQAMEIGKLLIKDGKATYPVIGASVGDESDGVTLTSIQSGGPAAKAGLRVDDVVSAIDDRDVASSEELIVAIRTHRPGEKVSMAYVRGQRKATATVTLGGKVG